MNEAETSGDAAPVIGEAAMPAPTAFPSPPVASLATVLRTVSDPRRLAVLRVLADGESRAVMALATQLNCHPDQMGRHLQRLWKVGLVQRMKPAEGTDLRSKYYRIPPDFRSTLPDGRRVLDFGGCVLRFRPKK